MTIKVYKEFRRSLNLFNLVVDRKQVIIKTLLCLVFLSVLLCGHSSAGTWRDTFERNELNGWERTAEHNHWNARWEVVEGILFSNIRKPHDRPKCEKNTADFLRWKTHQFQLDQLTVTGKEITYPQKGRHGMGELCLFLGKRWATPKFAAEGYIISPEEVSLVTFSVNNDYSRGKTRAWYGDKFLFSTRHLKVVLILVSSKCIQIKFF